MNVTTVAALTYSLVTLVVVAFQVALALGAPWGAYTVGGAFPGRLPPAMRLAALAQAVLAGLMAVVVLSHAGLALPGWSQASGWLTWLIVAFAALSVALNAISRSAEERRWRSCCWPAASRWRSGGREGGSLVNGRDHDFLHYPSSRRDLYICDRGGQRW